MHRAMLVLLLAATATAPLAAQSAAQSGNPPAIHEWNVPWPETRPRDPFADAQGNVWFVGQEGDYVGVLDPRTGQFRKYDLESGAGPHDLVVAPDGMVWYSGNRTGYLGRLDPATGLVRRFQVPDRAIRDPHTMVFDRRGDIWFTVQEGNAVGKLTVATGEYRIVRMPTAGARPYGIRMDPQDRPWFVEFGTNKLAMIDPASFALHEYTIPDVGARPRRMAITDDGIVWYGDYTRGFLGRFDPATRRFEEFALPSGNVSLPYALMNDDHGRVWVMETGPQPNRLVGFDPRTRRFLPGADVPSGGGTIRHMTFDARQGVMWFGSDAGTIGRATLPSAAPTP
jgi:virginiamycin B lyase